MARAPLQPRIHKHLGTTSSQDASIYSTVTARILEALAGGVVPWRKPWRGGDALPANAVTNRPYRGINLFLLSMAPFSDHRWLTFQQAHGLGGHVRKGARSSIAIFWKKWEIRNSVGPERESAPQVVPLLRFYRVFNVEQCEDLAIADPAGWSASTSHERIARAEAVVRSMPHPPAIREEGCAAWYNPKLDLVQVPPLRTFETVDAYYSTLLHELAHATGHESRLKRPGVTDTAMFGSVEYSREELVAELGSAFCCASLGLDNSLVENSASYIEG